MLTILLVFQRLHFYRVVCLFPASADTMIYGHHTQIMPVKWSRASKGYDDNDVIILCIQWELN